MAKGSHARPYLADVFDIRTRSRVRPDRPAGVSLAPSDFAFLWDECPRCFYMKVMRGQKRPRLPFPKVFGVIDRAMKACYLGQRTEMLDPDMPPGVISQADRWVESAGLNIPGSSVVSEIHGSLDALIHCDDGSVGVVDFKTAALNADLLGTYSRQLHAYAFALEQPGSGPPLQVSALGLLCFLPDAFTTGHHAALTGQLKWLEIERDDTAFLRFLIEVAGILDEPEPPSASAECTWCGWGARTGVS